MHFLIYGAGAIGGYLGSALALAGETVSFIARPAQAAILNERGLTLRPPEGETRTAKNIYAFTSPAQLFSRDAPVARLPLDAIILALKSFDTNTAIADLKAAGHPIPPIICVQNGVDNETKLREAYGPNNVIAGTVLTAVSTPEPGLVVIEKSRGVGLGGGAPLVEKLAAALRLGGVRTDLYPNPDSMKWSKLITNLMANATAAICDLSTHEVYTHPGLFEIEVRQMREALHVMDAKGLSVVALPRTPTTQLAFALRWLPSRLYQPIIRRAVSKGRGDKKPSFHQDLSASKTRSEVRYLNGAVAAHAEALGLNAPVNLKLTEILEGIVEKRIDWDEYRNKPDKLAKEILKHEEVIS
jgi:2-dehydropantoate 2-reductase